MSVLNEYNKKMCPDIIAGNYRHLFSMLKKGLRNSLNGFSLTQLRDHSTVHH